MTNWKTTAVGLATAAFGFVLFSPQYFPAWMIDLSKYAMVGGLASMGILSKDYNSHSTSGEVQASTIESQVKK